VTGGEEKKNLDHPYGCKKGQKAQGEKNYSGKCVQKKKKGKKKNMGGGTARSLCSSHGKKVTGVSRGGRPGGCYGGAGTLQRDPAGTRTLVE